MSKIFKSDFLNEYFAEALEKEDFTLEDLKEIGMVAIINEDPKKSIKITSEDLKILCSLDKEWFEFEGIDLSGVKFPKTVITNLEFSNCKLSNCDFSNLQVEGKLAFFDNNELNNNGISQFAHMKEAEGLIFEECEKIDLSDLSSLKNIKYLKVDGEAENIPDISDLERLETISISRINGVLPCLSDSIRIIEIDDPNLLDIGLLKNYHNLEKVKLLSSKLDISQIEILCELKRRNVQIIFDETNLKEQLSENKYEFEEKDLETVKMIFGLPDDVELNDYELFKHIKNVHQRLKLRNIDILDELMKSGLLSDDSIISKLCDIEGIDFVVENLEGISQDVIEYITQNENKKFRFVVRTLNGLDGKMLEALNKNGENIEFYVQGDMFHFQNKKNIKSYRCKHIVSKDLDDLVPYKVDDIKEFISALEAIKEETLETENDLEKFATIRKIALMSLDYDNSGVIDSDEFKEGREIVTRSLKDVFLEGKAVCAGNALGFLIMSEYVGLEAKQIDGESISKGTGHSWNQIKITDEDNKPSWYNYDITNDPDIIYDESRGILEDDETFYKRYTPDKYEKVEICSKNIQNASIHDESLNRSLKEGNILEELLFPSKEATPGEYSGKKITKENIKSILGSLTLSEMNYYTQIIMQATMQNSLGIEKA